MWWSQTVPWCAPASWCPLPWMKGDGRRPKHPQPSHRWSHSELLNLAEKCIKEKHLYLKHIRVTRCVKMLYRFTTSTLPRPCWLTSRYLDKRSTAKCDASSFSAEKKTHHVPRRLSVVGPKIRDVGRESLIEPQVVPPLHGHQVSEPLRAQTFTLLAAFQRTFQSHAQSESFCRRAVHNRVFSVIPYERAHGRWLLPPSPCLHWTTPQDYTRGWSLCRWSGPSSPWLQQRSQEEQSGLRAMTKVKTK